jgi:uncharacterized protein (DUF4415 family)
MTDDRVIPPHMMAEMEALAAMPETDIDLTEMPQVAEWRNQDRGLWHRMARLEEAVPLEPDLLDWFRTHGDIREDWRTRVNRALREYVAKAEQEAA